MTEVWGVFSMNPRNGFLKLNQIFAKSSLEESMLTEYLNASEGVAYLVLFERTEKNSS